MREKPKTLWVVLVIPGGYRAQSFVHAGKMYLPSKAVAASDLSELRNQLPRLRTPDDRFRLKNPHIVEAWAA